jgi:DNA polymerase elongation subunit (family B)
MLEVPVGLYLTNTGLLVVGGGSCQEFPYPVPPFEIAPSSEGHGEEVTLIGPKRERVWISRNPLPEVPLKTGADGRKRALTDYVLDLVREYPDVVKSLCRGDVYPAFLDIETADSLSPERGEILSIQIGYLDGDDIFLRQDEGNSEVQIIQKFIELMNTSPSGKTPDLVVSFNGNKFDISYLKGRARILHLMKEWHTMDRTASDIYYSNWLRASNENETVEVAKGLYSYDLYIHAKADLKLAGLSSRGLKSVSEFYGSKDVLDLAKSEKMAMRTLLEKDPAKFKEYALSDIRQTRFLWGIYGTRTGVEANMLSVPFVIMHRMSSGQKSYIPLYRTMREHKYWSFERNSKRNSDLYEMSEKYQGAIVDSFAHGYFEKIIYADAASMYPSIMVDFNLSPDRYRLVKTIPFSHTDVRSIRTWGPPEARIFQIPDENYGVVLEFEVDLVNDGYIRKLINYYNAVRKDYKRKAGEYESSKDPEDYYKYLQYDSMQMAAKVFVNTIYGLNGNPYYEIADLPQAIFVTAMGRWIITTVMSMFPKGSILEVDTDGVLLDRTKFSFSIDDVNTFLHQRMYEEFGLPLESIKTFMEFEGAGSIYLYKQKNYILRKDGKKNLIIKGSAFVGYDKAPIVKRAVNLMSEAVMYKNLTFDEARRRSLDLNVPLDEFKFTKTLKRSFNEYRAYDDIDYYVFSVNAADLSNRDYLAEVKRRSKEWIDKKYGKSDSGKELKHMIGACKTEDDVSAIMMIAKESSGKSSGGSYFLLDLLMQMVRRGHDVSQDTVIEYFMAPTKSGFALAEDIHDVTQINRQKYLVEINRILDRFSYADDELQAMIL